MRGIGNDHQADTPATRASGMGSAAHLALSHHLKAKPPTLECENKIMNKCTIAKLKRLYLFEKEKGGVGSTGSLATVAHLLIMRGEEVEFIEASLSQRDIINAYGQSHRVHEIDLTGESASDDIIDIIDKAPPESAILANIPGGRFEELDGVHELIRYATELEHAVDVDVNIIWTMGLDKASRVTLDAMLDGAPPGRVMLNLPEWLGSPEDFTEVDEALVTRIEQGGGCVFQMPKLRTHIYDFFRTREIAFHHIAAMEGVTVGNRMALRQWEDSIRNSLAEIF